MEMNFSLALFKANSTPSIPFWSLTVPGWLLFTIIIFQASPWCSSLLAYHRIFLSAFYAQASWDNSTIFLFFSWYAGCLVCIGHFVNKLKENFMVLLYIFSADITWSFLLIMVQHVLSLQQCLILRGMTSSFAACLALTADCVVQDGNIKIIILINNIHFINRKWS